MENKEILHKEEIGLRPIIVNYLLHWKLILGVGFFAVILGILYLIFYPQTYETMARVQIQDENNPLSSGGLALGEAAGLMKSFGLGGMSSGSIVIDDEIATFTSNSLLSEMVYELGLFAEYSEPFTFGYRLYGDEPIYVTADSLTIAQLDETIEFSVSVSPDKVKIKAKTKKKKENFQFNSLPATVKLEQGEFTFDHTTIGKEKSSYKININMRSLTSVAEDLFSEFTVEELSKTSNVIEFITTDYEKKRSKDIFNTLIRIYNTHAMEYKNGLGQNSLDFLDGRIDNLLSELSDVENAIESYKTKNKITMVESDVKYYADYMKELQIKIIETEAQTQVIKLMEKFIKDPANQYKLVPSLLTTGSDAENSPLALYNQALLERERIIKNSGSDNPMIAPLTLQIDKLRESVYQMIENANESIQLVVQELKAKEKSILSRMGEVPQQERVYMDYKRQQEILQGVYLILLQKREEIALSIGQSKDKAKIIDPAFTKPLPIAPRKLYAAIGIMVFTLVITVGWIFCKEQYFAFKSEFNRVKKEKQ